MPNSVAVCPRIPAYPFSPSTLPVCQLDRQISKTKFVAEKSLPPAENTVTTNFNHIYQLIQTYGPFATLAVVVWVGLQKYFKKIANPTAPGKGPGGGPGRNGGGLPFGVIGSTGSRLALAPKILQSQQNFNQQPEQLLHPSLSFKNFKQQLEEPLSLTLVSTRRSPSSFVGPSIEVSTLAPSEMRDWFTRAGVTSIHRITNNGDSSYIAFLFLLLKTISEGRFPTKPLIDNTVFPESGIRPHFINLLYDVESDPSYLEKVFLNDDRTRKAIRYLRLFLEGLIIKAQRNNNFNEDDFKKILKSPFSEGTQDADNINKGQLPMLIKQYVHFSEQETGLQLILMLANAFHFPLTMRIDNAEYPSLMPPLSYVSKDETGLFVGCIPDVAQKKSEKD